MSVGPSELVVILIVVLLLFGSRRLADLGKGIGEAIGGFKRGLDGESDADKRSETKKTGTTSTPSASNPNAHDGIDAGTVASGGPPQSDGNDQSSSAKADAASDQVKG